MTAIGVFLFVAFGTMLAELRRSTTNERRLRADGAIEPADDVYRLMAVAYPLSFAAMAGEGLLRGGASAPPVLWVGVAVYAAGKALKYWAIATLGPRWSFNVLVVPGAPLVRSGPYRWMRHPNYVGLAGEYAGAGLWCGAWIAGPLSAIAFGWLLARRIAVEERALRAARPQEGA